MKLAVNKIVKYLILSDVAFWTGWGILAPVFAIFIVQKIQGGSALVVGIASAVYWLTKSVLMVPIGISLDSKPSERDDFWALFFGTIIASLVPLGYIFAVLPWHIYLLQAIYGLGLAMLLSGWLALFTRHIDKGKEATEWSLESTAIGLGIGLASVVGGGLVTYFDFNLVFLLAAVFGLSGAVVILSLKDKIEKYAVPGG